MNSAKEIRVNWTGSSVSIEDHLNATKRLFEGVDTQDLIWFAEAKCHLILMHELAILLGAFGPHFE